MFSFRPRKILRLEYVAKRDKRICHICKEPVNKRFNKNHPERGTVDHVIPSSLGGSSELKNLKLAHLKCNKEKGNSFSWKENLEYVDEVYFLKKENDELNIYVFNSRIVWISTKKWFFKKGDNIERSLEYWKRNGYEVTEIF